MGAWIRNLSLKYKFWAVNAVAFFTTLLLVLFAMHQELAARDHAAMENAQAQARLLRSWPANAPLPSQDNLLIPGGNTLAGIDAAALARASGWVDLAHADSRLGPLAGAWVETLGNGQKVAILAPSADIWQVFSERAPAYAFAVLVLMLALLAASQLLIRFILTHLLTLRDVMLHVGARAAG